MNHVGDTPGNVSSTATKRHGGDIEDTLYRAPENDAYTSLVAGRCPSSSGVEPFLVVYPVGVLRPIRARGGRQGYHSAMQGGLVPSAAWSLRAVTGALGLALASGLCPLPTASSAAAHTATASKGAHRSARAQAMVQGAIDCSDVLSKAGYAGSSLELQLSSGSANETLQYPNSMAIPGQKGIFGSPTYELYRFTTIVPRRTGV
jgi:hypothetical protein